MYACVFVCVSTPEAINDYWHDVAYYNWLSKFHGFCMAVVVGVISGRDVSIHMRHGN